MVICLEQSADLHMAQLMPLPLTVSCFSNFQIGVTFLVPAYPGTIVPEKVLLNMCVCYFHIYKESNDVLKLSSFSYINSESTYYNVIS